MSFLSVASAVSVWRGWEYYTQGNVLSCRQINADEYEGEIAGSGSSPYHVRINIAHPRKSVCNCPHADGRQIICKHKVALYFTVYPKEAEAYLAEMEAAEREQEEYEREQERLRQERYEALKKYVMNLSKRELQDQLLEALLRQNLDEYFDEDDYDEKYWD